MLTITDKFRTSNDLCPVNNYEITSGEAQYDFVDDGSVDVYGDRTFTLTLNEETDTVVGVFPYEITAKAQGSEEDSSGTGTAKVTAEMEVQKICISHAVEDFQTVINVPLPKEGTEEETFPSSSADYSYIHAPTDGCTQTFSYAMSNAGVPPEELTIDSTSGIFTIVKDYESKSIYEINLIVDTTGGVNDERLTIPNILINVVCDDHSTDVVAPEALQIKSKASFQYDYNLAV